MISLKLDKKQFFSSQCVVTRKDLFLKQNLLLFIHREIVIIYYFTGI